MSLAREIVVVFWEWSVECRVELVKCIVLIVLCKHEHVDSTGSLRRLHRTNIAGRLLAGTVGRQLQHQSSTAW